MGKDRGGSEGGVVASCLQRQKHLADGRRGVVLVSN